MEPVFAEGFPPVCDENSRLLVLGSFPSVKSRAVGFYYGNPQNRFWKTVCGFFGEEVPPSVEEKRAFLLRRGIALWDVAASCEIVGSSDSSIRGVKLVDLPGLLKRFPRLFLVCNGSKSFELLRENFPELEKKAVRLPSTSPANPRFSAEAWESVLSQFFPDGKK